MRGGGQSSLSFIHAGALDRTPASAARVPLLTVCLSLCPVQVYVTANIGWSVLLVLLLLAECVGYAHFRTAILFHALTVAFFLLFDYLYFMVRHISLIPLLQGTPRSHCLSVRGHIFTHFTTGGHACSSNKSDTFLTPAWSRFLYSRHVRAHLDPSAIEKPRARGLVSIQGKG